ncbi:DNA/RNA-binding protein KIN17, related [Eimeria brunetti]|uniref:DNA/RNA-binding protein KIN17, related n=1 Tax=Eimeria brunetti TaxID=51314 RepID=U6LU63_9EIME|nr:DNA/RNA-binding protein KIN17, related [Eimeria brunetti]
MSEGHQRAMQLFIQRPGKFMDEFSKEFEEEFMKLMRTRYCRTRVLANSVYNNVVCDRHHIHMNSTIWVTLSEFVQYLGATKKCKIDYTPKGWYVEYIDHEELAKKEEEAKRRKIEKSQEDARMEQIQALVEEAKKRGGFKQPLSAMEALVHEAHQRKEKAAAFEKSPFSEGKNSSTSDRRDRREREESEESQSSSEPQPPPHKYAEADWWVQSGIIVKVMHKTLGDGRYYKQKGVIKTVDGRYSAVLEMLEGGAILKLDQEFLETVIPPIGGRLAVVLGKWRGHEGRLEGLDVDSYSVQVTLDTGPLFKHGKHKGTEGEAKRDLLSILLPH